MANNSKLLDLIEGFNRRDRMALAKIITLVESTTDDQPVEVDWTKLMKSKHSTIRVAVSGPPGVGKSTFINALGRKILAQGFKLAVLPIDPSSEVALGSILADKTRMKDLLNQENVFIRPSPAKGALGGIAITTSDVLFVTEAFGFDFIIVETVGVGQSETLARTLTDHFVLLVQPGSGDQLQAMKKGILERADFILVNKTDDEQQDLAKKTWASLKSLNVQGEHERPMVSSISALQDVGIDSFFQKLLTRHKKLKDSGELDTRRNIHLSELFNQIFVQVLASRLAKKPAIKEKCREAVTDLLVSGGPMRLTIDRIVGDIFRTL